MTQDPESNPIQKLLDSCPDSAEISYSDGRCIVISWSLESFGFGEYTFFKDKDGVWKIDSETNGRKGVKKVLEILVDSLELVD